MKSLVINLIKIYQKTLSPNILGFFSFFAGCRFYPSCSDYSIKAVEKFGPIKGSWKSVIRILRCGPWSKGGADFP